MSCTYYSWKSGTLFGDYWCDKKDCRVDNKTYNQYCKGYNYNNCPIYKKSNSSGCFITTVVCQILGKSDDDKALNNLRNFRDNILSKNEEYFSILKDYDNIGPILVDYLEDDKDKEKMAQVLYVNVIELISKQIENREYKKAIYNYECMILSLISHYELKHLFNKNKSFNYDYQKDEFIPEYSGHGKRKKLINNH